MEHLPEGFEFDGYKVALFLKTGIYNDTYRILDAQNNSFFMKLYELSKVPEKLIDEEGEVREVRLCRDIHHSNIISFQAEGSIQWQGARCPYMVTDYFSGELLADKLNRSQTLPCDEAMEYIGGVIDGLEYLHSKDLVHNDITPRNIMFDAGQGGETMVKIIDMGHTSPPTHGIADFLTQDLDFFYRAPETFGGMYEKESDVYSTAAVLYTMLVGHAPWSFDISDKLNNVVAIRLKLRSKRQNEPLDFDDPDNKIPECIKKTIVDTLTSSCDDRLDISNFRKALKGEVNTEHRQNASTTPPPQSPLPHQSGAQEEACQCQVPVQKGEGGGFEDVAGMQALKDMLKRDVIFVLKDKERAKRYKLTTPNGILFYGPPGCGKTFFAEKFAAESGFNFMLVKASDLGSIYVHGSQGMIADLFKKAAANAPTIICFDEFDALVPQRDGVSNQNQAGEVNEFLSELNNCAKKGIFVIGTSNRPDKIDPAVLRTGRIDKMVYIPLPDLTARKEIFSIHLKDRPCKDIDIDSLAEMTDSYVASDIAYIVNDAAMTAAYLDEPITQERLITSIKCTHPSVSKKNIAVYEEIRRAFEGDNAEMVRDRQVIVGFRKYTQEYQEHQQEAIAKEKSN
jgi:transitional endoplasmic reticulum ATPase